jgi:GR25 family glycosyltransferase involved in LPS biosynthesis
MWSFIIALLLLLFVTSVILVIKIDSDNLVKTKNYLDKKYLENPKKINTNIPIYYINLERSKERREFMENESNRCGVTINRVDAIDGSKLESTKEGKIEINGRKIKYKYSGSRNTNEIACTLSHMRAIDTLYNTGKEYGLIMEDDVSFSMLPFQTDTFEDVISRSPVGWDIIKLNGTFNIPSVIEYFDETKYFKTFSAAAYIINRKGMENILRQIDSDNVITLSSNNFDALADIYLYSFNQTYLYTKPMLFTYNVNLKTTIAPLNWDLGFVSYWKIRSHLKNIG